MTIRLILLFILFFIFVFGLGGSIVFGLAQTHKTQHHSNQQRFLTGTVEQMNGLYTGSIPGYTGSWRGKMFNPTSHTGVNVFEDNGEMNTRYPFKTYEERGLQDKELTVLKVDYNIKENPFWVRWVLDEIVKTQDGAYLGKIHVRIIPGLPFSLGYFQLAK